MTELPFLFDTGPIAAVQRFLGLGWPGPWRVISLLGGNWGLLFVLGLAFWLRGRRLAYSVLAIVAVDGVLKTALNRILFVPRPDGASLVKYERVGVGSFPSGHMSTGTALWAWLSIRGLVGWLLSGTLIVLLGVSRLYLGVHYVGDIVGGVALAALVLAIVHWGWPSLRAWLARLPWAVWVALAGVALVGVGVAAFTVFGANPYQWRAGGLVAGLAVALPLEHRFVRYTPGEGSRGRKALMVLLGAAGIAACALLDKGTGEVSNALGLAATAAGAIWVVLVAPTLFAVLGWSKREHPELDRVVARTGKGLAVAGVVLAAVVAWGMGVEPRLLLDREDETAPVPGLPPAWEDARIAVVADFQVGLWLDNTGLMRRAVDAIVEADPEVAILAGDFIYHPERGALERIREVMSILRPLTGSDIPTYAVLGNHDWGLPKPRGESDPDPAAARMLEDSLEAAGVTMLRNGAVALDAPGGEPVPAPLYLVGVGSNYMGIDRPRLALRDVPADAPRFTVMHNPTSFPDFPARSAPVAVAGHTHGGQFRIPFTPEWTWLNYLESDSFHADGWVEDGFGAEGNRLYVNRGLGMSLLPMRLNCPPEVTFFRLTAADR